MRSRSRAGQRQQGRPERVEEFGPVHRCLSDPPPTVVPSDEIESRVLMRPAAPDGARSL